MLKLSLFGVQHLPGIYHNIFQRWFQHFRCCEVHKNTGDAGRSFGPTGAKRPKTSQSAVHEAKRRRGQENRLPRALAPEDLTWEIRWEIRWDGDLGILTGPTGQSYKPWDMICFGTSWDYFRTWASVCSQLWSRLPKNQSCRSSHKDLDTPSHSARFRHACSQFCITCDTQWSSATLIILDTSLTACSPSLEFLEFLGFHAYKWRHHQQTLGAPRCYLSMSTDCTFAIQKLDALQLHSQCSNDFRNWTMMNSSIYLHDPGCKHL